MFNYSQLNEIRGLAASGGFIRRRRGPPDPRRIMRIQFLRILIVMFPLVCVRLGFWIYGTHSKICSEEPLLGHHSQIGKVFLHINPKVIIYDDKVLF